MVFVCVLLPRVALAAQLGAAGMTGVVRDASGAPAPGATVTLAAVDGGRTAVSVTSDAGLYAFSGLNPAPYRLTVTLQGFRTVTRGALALRTGETVRLDLTLVVGDVSELVTVAAETPILRDASASLGQVVDHQRVVQLPLNGRSFISLAALAPGVALPPGSQFPRINGGRPRTNEYLFDGISVLQPEPGQVPFVPVLDAIQEFKIESNSPPAEFGRFNGGVINLTTKSGSNARHGTLFEFARHEALNARNFFASADVSKPRFRRHQFGGTLGGPIVRDRTFFFVDYQGQRQAIGRTVISTVPTLLQRQGIFTEPIGGRTPVIHDPVTRAPFSAGTIPVTRFDPAAGALLQRFPLPSVEGTANNYRRTAAEADDQNQFDARVDHQLGAARDQLFARISHFRGRFLPVTPLPDGSGVTTGTLGPQETRAWGLASSYQHAFSGQWVNQVRFGDTRRNVVRTAARDGRGILPTFQVAGYQQLGSPPNTESDFGTSVTQLADTMTWITGRHTVKAGFDLRWQRLNIVQPPSPAGLYQFSALFTDLPGTANTGTPLASFLLGQVQTFSIDLQAREIRNRARIQEYFLQDDWRLSDRFTLSPGLRYTLNFPSVEKDDQAAVFNIDTRQLEFLGRDGHPRAARQLHKLNFGPRLGMVGRLDDATVVSAGYALVWIEQAGITTPFTTPVFPFLQTVSQRTIDNLVPAFTLAHGPMVQPIPVTPMAGLGQGVFAVDRDLGSGYVQQWNVSAQRSLGSVTAVEVAYVGSKITRVGIPDSNINQLSVEQLALGPALLERVPNPYFGIVPRSSSLGDPTITRAQLLKPFPEYTTVSLYRNNVGTSFYQGLTARIERRFSRRLSYTASYTRSKLMDDASSVFDASILTGPVTNAPVADSFNRKGERDFSTGDIPHLFVSSVIWEPAAGWTLAGIVTLQSGIPVAVTQATNFNAFAGFGTQRPDVTRDPELPAAERGVARWFDTGAFTAAPQFTLGNASRNPVRGPSYRNVDVAVIRRIAVRAGMNLEVRGEVFNLLNTPPLGNPNAVVDTASFGTITTAGDPRVAQLAARIAF